MTFVFANAGQVTAERPGPGPGRAHQRPGDGATSSRPNPTRSGKRAARRRRRRGRGRCGRPATRGSAGRDHRPNRALSRRHRQRLDSRAIRPGQRPTPARRVGAARSMRSPTWIHHARRTSRTSKSAAPDLRLHASAGTPPPSGSVAARSARPGGSLAEAGRPAVLLRKVTAGPVTTPAQPDRQVSTPARSARRPSGLGELDRVLGGGLVPGGVVLLAGEPGVGKSTLLLSAAQAWAAGGQGPALIVTGEESAGQVRLRADRMGALHPDIVPGRRDRTLAAVLGHIDQVRPRLLIVDSVQTVASAEVDGTRRRGHPGPRGRRRADRRRQGARHRLRAGRPRHQGRLRSPGRGCWSTWSTSCCTSRATGTRRCGLIRGVKNRFGPSDEVGCFQMTATASSG